MIDHLVYRNYSKYLDLQDIRLWYEARVLYISKFKVDSIIILLNDKFVDLTLDRQPSKFMKNRDKIRTNFANIGQVLEEMFNIKVYYVED